MSAFYRTARETPFLDAARRLGSSVDMITNPRNLGHGPSLMIAYARAVEAEPDFVLQVDGDGQFHGSDLRRVLVLLVDEARAVCGVRRFRQDPSFRMAMTRLLRGYLSSGFRVRARDANCPLRGDQTGLLGSTAGIGAGRVSDPEPGSDHPRRLPGGLSVARGRRQPSCPPRRLGTGNDVGSGDLARALDAAALLGSGVARSRWPSGSDYKHRPDDPPVLATGDPAAGRDSHGAS